MTVHTTQATLLNMVEHQEQRIEDANSEIERLEDDCRYMVGAWMMERNQREINEYFGRKEA